VSTVSREYLVGEQKLFGDGQLGRILPLVLALCPESVYNYSETQNAQNLAVPDIYVPGSGVLKTLAST
jgi:hypothetical protein